LKITAFEKDTLPGLGFVLAMSYALAEKSHRIASRALSLLLIIQITLPHVQNQHSKIALLHSLYTPSS